MSVSFTLLLFRYWKVLFGFDRCIPSHGLQFTCLWIMWECGMWGLRIGFISIWASNFILECIPLQIHGEMSTQFQVMLFGVARLWATINATNSIGILIWTVSFISIHGLTQASSLVLLYHSCYDAIDYYRVIDFSCPLPLLIFVLCPNSAIYKIICVWIMIFFLFKLFIYLNRFKGPDVNVPWK